MSIQPSQPVELLPRAMWEIRAVTDSDYVGLAIATEDRGAGAARTVYKVPWAALPNSLVHMEDIARCGAMPAFTAWKDAAFLKAASDLAGSDPFCWHVGSIGSKVQDGE